MPYFRSLRKAGEVVLVPDNSIVSLCYSASAHFPSSLNSSLTATSVLKPCGVGPRSEFEKENNRP